MDLQTGEITHQKQVPTQAWEGHEAVMQRIAGLVDGAIGASGVPKSEIGAIGIGVPGQLDLEKGETLFLPNLPGTWPNVPLAATVSALTGLPVYLLNDVRSITSGEWKFGAGRGVDTTAVFAIGTGIGGGLVTNNRLHLGIGGTAGELGHQTIDFNGLQCGCGNHGCLEAFASGPAFAALGMKAVAQGLTARITELVEHDLNRITPEMIARAARAGDRIAREIYEQAGGYIGITVASIMVAITPQRVVIGAASPGLASCCWIPSAGARASGCSSCRKIKLRSSQPCWATTRVRLGPRYGRRNGRRVTGGLTYSAFSFRLDSKQSQPSDG